MSEMGIFVRRDKTFMNASRSPLVTKTMAALRFDW
jgi:hypothetical protein